MNTVMWLLLVCVGVAMSDQSASSYAAPQAASYSAPPATSYGSPPTGGTGYAAPATGYGAPATGSGYETGGTGYGPTGAEEVDAGKDIASLIPLFLAVFAAVILASLLGPLLGAILALIVAILPGALTPKAVLWNFILNFFGLQLCDQQAVPVAFPGRAFTSRAFADQASGFGLNLSEDQATILLNVVQEGISSVRSHFS